MAVIKPFRALRFTEKAGPISELVCPPYDIIDETARLAYLRRNPHNVIRLELPKEGSDVYATAGETLQSWIRDGILKKDERDAFYVYEEAFTLNGKNYSFVGLICLVKLEEFEKGVVLPHEETLSKAKTDRFRLMCATGCNFSQVYSLYEDHAGTARRLDAITAGAPDVEFTDDDGVIQRLWTVTDPEIAEALAADFANRKLYIADGHHRYETALNYRNRMRETGRAVEGDPCDYVLMTLVNMRSPGLVVFPTHRIVRNLPDFDAEALLADCKDYFDVEAQPSLEAVRERLGRIYEESGKAFGFFARETGWRLLTLRSQEAARVAAPEKSEALALLDVSLLHDRILEPKLGIDKASLANQTRLTYTRSDDEAFEAVQDGNADCCFILNPTKVAEIAAVAAAGEKMPQKSTYFYPKLITGLIMNQF